MRRFLAAALLGVLIVVPTAAQAQSPQSQAAVTAWYSQFLQRPFDSGGLGWAVALDQGQSPDKVLASILGSDEYYIRSGSTPQGYVQAMFTDLNRGQPTPAEYSFWVNRLIQIGGAAPDNEQRVDLAYDLLVRYLQNEQYVPPVVVAPPVAPTVVVPPPVIYGRNYGLHDDYEYRRPFVPAVRVERDHRIEQARHEVHDHHDDHDHKR